MTENNLENRVNHLETKFEVFVQEMHDFKDEMRDFRKEMRDRDNQRAAEISELRQKQETDMREIRSSIEKVNDKIDGMEKHVRNLTTTAIIGIGAMAILVVGFVISIALKQVQFKKTISQSSARKTGLFSFAKYIIPIRILQVNKKNRRTACTAAFNFFILKSLFLIYLQQLFYVLR